MSSWSFRRQAIYLFILLLPLIGLGYFLYSHYVYTAPTCFDGKQNGAESGIDCGGGCQLICSQDSYAPVVLWSKAFQVTKDVWNATAYVQNPNNNQSARSVSYEFKLFDEKNIIVATRKGIIDILPGKTFVVFEGGIQTSGKTISRTEFQFLGNLTWKKGTATESKLDITPGSLQNASSTPTLTGTITNPTLVSTRSIELVVLISDDKGNTINTSKTIVDPLAPGASAPFIFTWPMPFPVGTTSTIQIVSRILNN